MRLLALDQSSAITGWAIFENGEFVKSGVLDIKKEHDSETRVRNMMLLIGCLIRSKHPDCVVIEDAYRHFNEATYKMLNQIQGAILYYCYDAELPLKILAASTWRSILGFNQGRKVTRWRLKQQSVDFVKDNYGKEVSNDEADAICIGHAAIKEDIFGK